ncbi:hypothetical protein JWJ88_00825 [Paracoccus methylovorus]|uniref:Uncharacterized protein n=1 Tax=Paracoccus methylovorus TaxID=2812658 RepID=A0ABX7JG78_9RHOB|nr:hypothetical protein [Paracoccus methylovorus]QRZ13237.1 hypothetical protein JWJ88_00825 [Paracoccus methylovorus]
MTRNRDALAGLERIARLKADVEMRRLAAFRAQVEAVRHRIGQLEAELETTYRADQPFSIAEARMTNAMAGERSRALLAAEEELARILPGYELARQAAAREFGRGEAVHSLRKNLAAQIRKDRIRRGDK